MTSDYVETMQMISKVLENADEDSREDRAIEIFSRLYSPLDDLDSVASAVRKDLYALYKNDDWQIP